ncbi:MAG: metallophosphoesterase [Bryobacteraceae bacterium]
MAKLITKNVDNDGVDRRGFLECMAWAGTAVAYSLSGGVARSQLLTNSSRARTQTLDFVQISDSHMGFNKKANKDVAGTLQETVSRINALPSAPAFLIHTGDISHLSKPEEFDNVDQILKSAKVGEIFYVPGEHDVLTDNGRLYLDRYSKGNNGWFSFDRNGVHFIGLVNVLNLKAGGLGTLGSEQLEWLEKDLKAKTGSTPIVVFAHVPLWTVYADWGWGTEDGTQALSYMNRFGSVTVLNGHIHQTLQKVEGNITFHTAASTAFPQPKPGSAPSPGPMKVPNEQLRSMLGMTKVRYVQGSRSLAIIDSTLEKGATASVNIDNFSFSPAVMEIAAGTEVTWTNHDDIPHNVVGNDKAFASTVLDTGDKFTHAFREVGEHLYYCSIHPKMTGKVIVKAV